MTKVTIQERFNTSMGLVFKVRNDRDFKVGEVVDFDDGKMKIIDIVFPTRPNDIEYIHLIVSKAS